MRFPIRLLTAFFLVIAMAPLGVTGCASAQVLVVETPEQTLMLDLDDLRALPQEVFLSGTIWTDGVTEFTGVPVSALLAHVGTGPRDVTVIAFNDYAVDIPASDIGPRYPIVAYLRDGAEFPLRDKGPFWIVYPYDAGPEYRTDETYARSVWQLARIRVVP
ncbi:oxidoreductase [Rhodobacter sp. NTK016B]|uniref:oxidoreductase n=1 Tax=Rhodobacter sp. NTK016B TaxID=2759676 RepID=UPI001A8E791B|nr:oxidoreductase [Rhodobacter sp. NTK016B]MBN8290951.1 oxidoreductase [Rhodobacter sp. NTK016B]